jgi:transcriptional regulator with XRE-family HTH domain
MDNTAVGERIKKARLRADLTQEDLGKRMGFSQPQVSAYEAGGVVEITVDTLEAFARATGTPIQEFLADMPAQPITLEEVLRRDYPDMDAGDVRTLELLAKFISDQRKQDIIDNMQRTYLRQRHAASDTGGTTSTPGEPSPSP